ncbi:MAG: hypothetical protein KIC86_02785 [Sutterella sp.]|jgi:hypothetical protein|uniref:hypothetical protein n=1 Tax=Mesosutterella multiformis TaxID=2259133 RepID=UPI000E54B632|nr:hypothetical protein [Sutterella sp.]RHH06043.1 hypothetical protein DW229_07410 [Sutterella sp. AM18-8-1]DAG77442.1 MAG TPA: hypothetical protein [Caudoviricetes sp.]DAL50435.1 MAG TPA_asm: hypothetical protein [Caudoviricetes sp.]
MTVYNRYTVQILMNCDSADSAETQRKLREALASVPKTRVRTISFDVWMDANKGIEKTYDESGDEITDSAAEG